MTPNLLLLPNELLFQVTDHLPLDAILALKLTHRQLNSSLPLLPHVKNRPLNRCARYAIERLLTPPEEQAVHLRCILCKMVYPRSMFTSSASPACLPVAFRHDEPKPDVVEIPPSFCAWHVGRLARVVRTETAGRNEWVSDVKKMCMHDGCIQGWRDCNCDCRSCGYKMVRTYTRYLNNEVECRSFHFGRRAAGRPYVQEARWNPSEFFFLRTM